MSTEQNKATVIRLFKDMWIKGDLALTDELVTTDYVNHHVLFPPGRQGLKQAVAMVKETFPAYWGEIEELVAEADRVVCRWVRYSVHQEDFMGVLATGMEVTIRGINICRLVDGRVAEEWLEFDLFGLLQQIGAIAVSEEQANPPWLEDVKLLDSKRRSRI